MLAMLRFNLAALIILVSAKGQHLLEIIEQVVAIRHYIDKEEQKDIDEKSFEK